MLPSDPNENYREESPHSLTTLFQIPVTGRSSTANLSGPGGASSGWVILPCKHRRNGIHALWTGNNDPSQCAISHRVLRRDHWFQFDAQLLYV